MIATNLLKSISRSWPRLDKTWEAFTQSSSENSNASDGMWLFCCWTMASTWCLKRRKVRSNWLKNIFTSELGKKWRWICRNGSALSLNLSSEYILIFIQFFYTSFVILSLSSMRITMKPPVSQPAPVEKKSQWRKLVDSIVRPPQFRYQEYLMGKFFGI